MIGKLIQAFLVSFAVAAAAGLFLVPYLRKIKMSEQIREDGPVWHQSKAGTPIMGGLIFIIGILLTCFTVGIFALKQGETAHILILGFGLVCGAIGFVDDYVKMRKKRNMGLTAIQKLLLQVAAAVVFLLLLRLTHQLTPSLYIPFVGVSFQLPEAVYFLLGVFIMVGCVNAVNITDGIDGLCTGVTIPVALFFAAVAATWGYLAHGIFAAALAGGLGAYLLYNYHPAKIWMGDTGSLFLGGVVCAMAYAYDLPLILLLVGIIYVWEALSDIIQVLYFKLSHGKRVFKMAPFHHHLEMCGWSEKKIFFVFTAISLVCCILAYFGVFQRYH